MKTIIILLTVLISSHVSAQGISQWRGNTPGHERDWNYPSNWSENQVPDEFTDVVIPVDIMIERNYPVIRSGDVEINSLSIWPGACLTIKEGTISVLDRERSYFNWNQIIGNGRISVNDETLLADQLERQAQ